MQTQRNTVEGIIARQRLNAIFKELFRKSIHICSSFVPLFLGFAYWPVIALLILAIVVYTISELLRAKGINIPLISKITEIAARKRDENRFVLGPVTLACGILIAALLLPLDCARVGIFALAFGDGLASLMGKLFGKITIPGAHGKTAAGSLTCFFAVFISTFCCCGNCLVSLITALCAMFIEVLPLSDFDNLIIPPVIGLIYSGLI
ncbi:Dolichol kinase [Treponema bryantii]|uniref:Dolichol kinase n=1 Tax=Treponema bryantii TaxID=163 RepID=A0A1H9EVV0_9SPIR|nr:phosphatidate cytidylyltransferase [Treponema bryantii]BDC94067.1 phosphatidate cytidylyltransferase [Treponema bryantii]SEQ29118.1 Dolichol kinase [Treponema bryantii]